MTGEPFAGDYAYMNIYCKDNSKLDDLQITLRVTSHDNDSKKRQAAAVPGSTATVGKATYKNGAAGQPAEMNPEEIDNYFNAVVE